MRKRFHLGALTTFSVDRAVELGLEDFEDALQIAVAEENAISLLVTGNLNDFQSTSKVKVLSVVEFLSLNKKTPRK